MKTYGLLLIILLASCAPVMVCRHTEVLAAQEHYRKTKEPVRIAVGDVTHVSIGGTRGVVRIQSGLHCEAQAFKNDKWRYLTYITPGFMPDEDEMLTVDEFILKHYDLDDYDLMGLDFLEYYRKGRAN